MIFVVRGEAALLVQQQKVMGVHPPSIAVVVGDMVILLAGKDGYTRQLAMGVQKVSGDK